ncbi:MAG: hypothetical protein RIG61_11435 [Deltaproteobacteria bacterium]
MLLYQLYELSNWNPPPGTNAASGAWRDKVVADDKIKNLGRFTTEGLTGDAAKLGEVFQVFYDGTYRAFSRNPNVDAEWSGEAATLRAELAQAGEKVYGISFNIYQSAGGDEAENKKFATEARNSARALIRTTDEKGPVYSGQFANPQIAVSEYNAAAAALQKLNQLFGEDYSGPAGLPAKLLRQVFTEITTIPTAPSGVVIPWLSPAWQVQFQYVCLTGSIVMEKISPPVRE